MTLPEFLHEHVVILFPVVPLMTTGRNEILVPVALAMQIPAIAVHPWIEEVNLRIIYLSLENEYGLSCCDTE